MLVLTRRRAEKILFPALNVTLEVVGINPAAVRLGVEAPADIGVYREEVWGRLQDWGPLPALPPPVAPTSPSSLKGRVAQWRESAAADLTRLRHHVRTGQFQQAQALLDQFERDLRSLEQELETQAPQALALPTVGAPAPAPG